MKAKTKAQKLCIKCQKCCKEVVIETTLENDDLQAISFYNERGFGVTRGDDGFLYLTISDWDCPHLDKGGCDIYPYRPKVCRDYDGREGYGDDCLLNALPEKKSKKKKGCKC